MNRLVMCTFSTVLLLLAAAASSEAAVRVYAKVEAETAIYPGDDFVYSIVVEGGGKPSHIDMSPLASFNPRRTGSGTSMQQIEDQMSISYSENYIITAGPAGKMTLPPVTVTVDSRTYTTNPVEVTVSQPGASDSLHVQFSLSERRCYAGQPVVMSVGWAATVPVQDNRYSIDVPVFRSEDFFIEDISDPTVAGGAMRASIDGVPVTVTETREMVNGMTAVGMSFRKVVIPKRAGRMRLDPVTVSTNIAAGRVRTGSVFNPYRIRYERVSVQSDPVELEVLPLPEAGKPAEFYGLVGQYTISAAAGPTKVNVGDPITLTMRIGGSPYLKPVQWPDLERMPELAENFRIPVEKASPVVEDGVKVFTQTIRANSDRVTEIPALPLAYFDPQQGRYVVARTDPIKLEVAPTKVLTDADVQATAPARVNREVEAIRKGLSANYYGPEVLTNQGFSPLSAIVSPGYAALWSIPLAGLVVSCIVKLAGRTSPESRARKRRRQAAAAAIRQLRMIAAASPGERHERLASAMKSYVGDRFDRVAGSLTAGDCRQIIAESTGDVGASARCSELISACEAARYAPVDAEIGTKEIQKAIEIIQSVEKQCRK